MKISFTFRGIKLAEQLRNLAEKKLKKLERYFHKDAEAHLIFSSLRGQAIVELNVYGEGLFLHGASTATNHTLSLKKVIDKLERRLKKYKEKIIKTKRHSKEDLNKNVFSEEKEQRLIRKQVHLKPMSVEEGLSQIGEERILIFRNAQTDQINVLYRLKDGKLCLIEPS